MKIQVLEFNKKNLSQLEREYSFCAVGASDRKIFRHIIWLLNKAGCTHLLLEYDYVDRDFSDDYSAFYSGVFFDHGKYCIRFHFFKIKDNDIDLNNIFGTSRDVAAVRQLYSAKSTLKEIYLGFFVLLPIVKGKIGRCMLSPVVYEGDELFCTALGNVHVNLEGLSLAARGMPFIQQDSQVGVCSSTAIWMVARLMNIKYKFPRYSLSRITIAANRYHRINRPFPAVRGLTIEQVISGFVDLGYTPVCYQANAFSPISRWDPKEIVYKYIESGLPVVLIIGGRHACVVHGHDFDCKKKIESNNLLVSNSNYIRNLIVHDDGLGPYFLLPQFSRVVPGAARYMEDEDYDPLISTPNVYTPYSLKNVTSIIVPTFKKVHLEGQQIEDMIRDALESSEGMFRKIYIDAVKRFSKELNEETKRIARKLRKIIEGQGSKGHIFYRARFLLSNDFKRDYLVGKKRVSNILSYAYARLDLPRYVWLAEFSLVENLCSSLSGESDKERNVVGEFLVDATGADDISSIISFHLPGFLIVNSLFVKDEDEDEDEDELIYYLIEDDLPYESYDRTRNI